tara:strand:+ start:137 stop:403 length:267 start_codon:yes stop_codon:yes gene_type:complete
MKYHCKKQIILYSEKMSTNKTLILLTVLGWLNIGLFYSLYLLKIENVFIGVFRELTIIPSYFLGILYPIIILSRLGYKFLLKIKTKKN